MTPLVALASFACCLTAASAATISSCSLNDAVGDTTDYLIASTGGTLMTSGYVGVGIFTLTDSQVADLASRRDYADLFAAFQPIGGTDDFIQMVGSSIYTLVSDNSDSSLATSFALFKSRAALSADFPPPRPMFYFITPYDSTIMVGTPGPNAAALLVDLPAVQTIRLVAVPEPSSYAIAITGLALASLRRRR